MSGKTGRVGSDPKDNGAGIDPTAAALVMTGARRERVDACSNDQQEPIAAELHHLAVNRTQLALAKFEGAEKYAPHWRWRA